MSKVLAMVFLFTEKSSVPSNPHSATLHEVWHHKINEKRNEITILNLERSSISKNILRYFLGQRPFTKIFSKKYKIILDKFSNKKHPKKMFFMLVIIRIIFYYL